MMPGWKELVAVALLVGCGSTSSPEPFDCGCSGDEACVEKQCVPSSCQDLERNGDETDIDCGGSCGPCSEGQECVSATDCASRFCSDGSCHDCETDDDCAAIGDAYCSSGACLSIGTPLLLGEGDGVAFGVHLYTDCDVVHAVWSEQVAAGGVYNLRYARSTDGGDTWSTPIWLFESDLNVFASLAGSGDDLYVLADEFEAFSQAAGDISSTLYLIQSHSEGSTWSVPSPILPTPDLAHGRAQIRVDGSTLNLVWDEAPSDASPLRRNIVFARSDNGGEDWTQATVTSDAGSDDRSARLEVDGDHIAVMWLREVPSPGAMFASTSDNGGTSWSTPVQISEAGATGQDRLATAFDPTAKVVYAVWDRYTDSGQQDVVLGRSGDMGKSWSSITTVGDTPDRDRNPAVAVTGSNGVVILHDVTRDNSDGKAIGEVDYRVSNDGGMSFGPSRAVPGTEGPEYSLLANAIFDCRGRLHVAWSDGSTDVPDDIWYYRFDQL